MEWVLQSPQIHSIFGNLGYAHADGYQINENCNEALESILNNILSEDKFVRSYRRNISFGQNIKKDIIPLLIHAKEDKTIELLIKILVHLTIPIECLLSVDVLSRGECGRHIVFELNNLLASIKSAFVDPKVTKVIIDFMKKNADVDQKGKLSKEQCTNINNCLWLIRNILHIPEEVSCQSPNFNGTNHTVQNQILWNIFSQSIDKALIKLMTIPDACNWGVTMVQLLGILYKDQHVVTLHKLLNLWLEASVSDSSEDNESNTSPPNRAGSDDSSPMLTSDPTSDSSDTGGSGKSNDGTNNGNKKWDKDATPPGADNTQNDQPFEQHTNVEAKTTSDNTNNENNELNKEMDQSCTSDNSTRSEQIQTTNEKQLVKSETSDCGYETQIKNQESLSTSSNEDEGPTKKPVHLKPHNPKQRTNTNKVRPGLTLQDRKRKKIVKRGKTNIINVEGLTHKTPTDDDISNVLKEFTVDFLVKGYNSLVQSLHGEILNNLQLKIDTSHFFWLVTYFLKFATQIELDLEHVCSILSYEIVSYLTAEGVNLCEQLELDIKLDGNDLTPNIRRLHLVVTAIREFVQAIEVYKKIPHLNTDDHDFLMNLQMKMCETDELRSLMVLLLRHYNPKHHSKQYLQDLVVTNHILLIFLDNTMKSPSYNCSTDMAEHIRQFATPEIMYKYGLLLEDYSSNGEFVNDCIFTLMHHVGGDLASLSTLFQPRILQTFTSIFKSEFEICDDWSDLIEYVINTFLKKPISLLSSTSIRLDRESLDDVKLLSKHIPSPEPNQTDVTKTDVKKKCGNSDVSNTSKERWTEEEISSLSWTYMQCSASSDVIEEIIKLLKEDGVTKSRDSVVRQLLKQNIVKKDEFEKLKKGESDRNTKSLLNKKMRDDEIGKLCEQLSQDGKGKFLDWVQKVLLDTCQAKLYIDKRKCEKETADAESKLLSFECFKKKSSTLPVISPVSYHSLLSNQSVPLVPWNCKQAGICKDLKFLQLLHRLGFHMPVDSGKLFIRIPHFWTADFLYDVAMKILPIDSSKFADKLKIKTEDSLNMNPDLDKNTTSMDAAENYYQIHKQQNLATMINFTPMPGAYFSRDVEIYKQNWLNVVQKSQETKISLNFESLVATTTRTEVTLGAVAGEAMAVAMAKPCLEPAFFCEAMSGDRPCSLHDLMPDKHDDFAVLLDPDNHSVCETASVASDLTRMYVSDEDEKPELMVCCVPTAAHLDVDVDPEIDVDVDPAIDVDVDADIDVDVDADIDVDVDIDLSDADEDHDRDHFSDRGIASKRPRLFE